jgi:hypothetical protein
MINIELGSMGLSNPRKALSLVDLDVIASLNRFNRAISSRSAMESAFRVSE